MDGGEEQKMFSNAISDELFFEDVRGRLMWRSAVSDKHTNG